MVSVIVPVYNVAPWLSACLQSIAAQTYADIEVILVNDGSTDASGKICDEWAKQDRRFSVIHQENQGLSAARNAGIDHSRGEFLTFVDSDDMIHPEMIATLVNVIGNNDIAMCGFMQGEECKWADFKFDQQKALSIPTQKAIEMVLYQDKLQPSAWAKLYRQTVFSYLRYRPGIAYEDLDLAHTLFARAAGDIVMYDGPLYFYRVRPQSILQTYSPKRLDVLEVVNRIEQHYSQHPILGKAARDRKFAANYNIFGISDLCDVGPEIKLHCWEEIKRLRTEVLGNPKSRLKNKLGALLSYFGPKITSQVTKLMYR